MGAYLCYETTRAALAPARMVNDAAMALFRGAGEMFGVSAYGRAMTAACEMFERTTREYAKPSFGIATTVVAGREVEVRERVVSQAPFCRVLAFDRVGIRSGSDPRVLVVAPMSGHYATLLRGTVEALLPGHEVFITDWVDARQVPLSEGRFGLDDYTDYMVDMFRALGPDLNVMAVCQPSVSVLAAIALMEADGDRAVPRSATLMGGPIDTRRSPTAVNAMAQERGLGWFESNCIATVPSQYAGAGRRVYPGFFQLSGFLAMNLDRHVSAHRRMFSHLIEGDGDSAGKHREFYDEYLSVMDLSADFYLSTVDSVFIEHYLPRGLMRHRGELVDLGAVSRCAIMAVEGEKDDITGIGQTRAALDLTPNLAAERKTYHLQAGVGHYGVFNGSRFRGEIMPEIAAFIRRSK